MRTCNVCKEEMVEGFVIDGGLAYYCTKKCMKHDYTLQEIVELDLGGDDSDNYWTEWENEDEEPEAQDPRTMPHFK